VSSLAGAGGDGSVVIGHHAGGDGSAVVGCRTGGDGISVTAHYHRLFADRSVAAMTGVDVMVVVAVVVVVHWQAVVHVHAEVDRGVAAALR